MGQQQLLLVILVTIIVGIATVVAINTFSSAAENANVDAVRQDIVSLASDAQGFYMKPGMMEGGANSFDASTGNEVSMDYLNCPGEVVDANTCRNENGTYVISARAADNFTLTGTPSSGADDLVATVYQDDVNFTN